MPNRRKPNQLHIADGTFRKDRHGLPDSNPEPETVKKALNPPCHLNKHAKAEWRRLSQGMIEEGLLANIDLSALEIACNWFGIYRDVAEELNKLPSLFNYLEQKSSQTNASIATMEKAYRSYTEIVYKFGVTPVERSKIQIEKKKEDDNPFAASKGVV